MAWQTATCWFTFSNDNRKDVIKEINVISLVLGNNSSSFPLCFGVYTPWQYPCELGSQIYCSAIQFSYHIGERKSLKDCRSFHTQEGLHLLFLATMPCFINRFDCLVFCSEGGSGRGLELHSCCHLNIKV